MIQPLSREAREELERRSRPWDFAPFHYIRPNGEKKDIQIER